MGYTQKGLNVVPGTGWSSLNASKGEGQPQSRPAAGCLPHRTQHGPGPCGPDAPTGRRGRLGGDEGHQNCSRRSCFYLLTSSSTPKHASPPNAVCTPAGTSSQTRSALHPAACRAGTAGGLPSSILTSGLSGQAPATTRSRAPATWPTRSGERSFLQSVLK